MPRHAPSCRDVVVGDTVAGCRAVGRNVVEDVSVDVEVVSRVCCKLATHILRRDILAPNGLHRPGIAIQLPILGIKLLPVSRSIRKASAAICGWPNLRRVAIGFAGMSVLQSLFRKRHGRASPACPRHARGIQNFRTTEEEWRQRRAMPTGTPVLADPVQPLHR